VFCLLIIPCSLLLLVRYSTTSSLSWSLALLIFGAFSRPPATSIQRADLRFGVFFAIWASATKVVCVRSSTAYVVGGIWVWTISSCGLKVAWRFLYLLGRLLNYNVFESDPPSVAFSSGYVCSRYSNAFSLSLFLFLLSPLSSPSYTRRIFVALRLPTLTTVTSRSCFWPQSLCGSIP
jgi:hypothetical protein